MMFMGMSPFCKGKVVIPNATKWSEESFLVYHRYQTLTGPSDTVRSFIRLHDYRLLAPICHSSPACIAISAGGLVTRHLSLVTTLYTVS